MGTVGDVRSAETICDSQIAAHLVNSEFAFAGPVVYIVVDPARGRAQERRHDALEKGTAIDIVTQS